MILCVNSFGQKKEYLDRFLLYYHTQFQITADCQGAFEFAQTNFLHDFGFLFYKDLGVFLDELIEIQEDSGFVK